MLSVLYIVVSTEFLTCEKNSLGQIGSCQGTTKFYATYIEKT